MDNILLRPYGGTRRNEFKTIVIGSGPAGMGLLFAAAKNGRLEELLNSGIAFIDQVPVPGGGSIGKYQVNSDTAGGIFLECLQHLPEGFPADPKANDLIRRMREKEHEAVPLAWVGEFLHLLSAGWRKILEEHPVSAIFSNTTAISASRHPGGNYSVTVRSELTRETFIITGATLVLAMGGRQRTGAMLEATIGENVTLHEHAHKIISSDNLLSQGGHLQAEEQLHKHGSAKAVIIGGSHSAFSSAWTLLNKVTGIPFGEKDITLLHRRKLKLFYTNAEEAL